MHLKALRIMRGTHQIQQFHKNSTIQGPYRENCS